MHQVERTDIECCRHLNPGPFRSQPLDEVEAHRALVEAPVDMSSRDVEKAGRPHRTGDGQQHPHGHGEAGACIPFQDRGIGFGLNSRGNERGIIRNNMIYHAANKGQFADVGIAIHNSPNTDIYNNTVFMEHSYPTAIEYRFSGTTNANITNNLTNKSIRNLDGASGTESSNIEAAQSNWFVNVSSGDLHLSSAIAQVVDQGQAVPGLNDDFDGEIRPLAAGIDIGADEYSSGGAPVRPLAPTNLVAE